MKLLVVTLLAVCLAYCHGLER